MATAPCTPGEPLYEAYTKARAEQNCSVDSWDQLDEQDQDAWDRTAELFWEAQQP